MHDDKLDHETVTYDVSDWEPEQFRALDMMLASAHIAHGLEDGMLVVPRVHQYDVDEIVDTIDADEFVEEPERPPPPRPAEKRPRGLPLATAWNRFFALFVDGVILRVAALPLMHMRHAHRFGTTVATLALSGVYFVVPIALWGRTIGARLWKLRVTTTTGDIPGWWRALTRWAVPSAVVVVTAVAGALTDYQSKLFAALTVLDIAWIILVYVGVFRDKQRQGLHDKAAGTIVVDDAYR